MQQPGDGIARELLHHIHLVSTYRYPLLPILHPDNAAEWLFAAPKIAQNQAPFYWTYLDRPQDGTILLVWQSPSLGLELPSDGFVWAPGEIRYQVPASGGCTLEMYHQKVGYVPGEPIAYHIRRRYRIVPPHGSNVADPNMWIVHYAQCDPKDRVASNAITITPQIQSMLQTRQYLQQQGQIVQKEFMLHDRNNWPTITFPRAPTRPQYAQAMPPTRIPQQMAYPVQHTPVGPPKQRVRRPELSGSVPGGAMVPEGDDEENTAQGDFFDFTTPREISSARYKQKHEWMEEILSSPYSMNQIIPPDLGLGRTGDLAALTDGFFDAPGTKDGKHTYIGRLDPGYADEFRQRSAENVTETNKEIERMKAKHAKRLAKFQRGSVLSTAEKMLRTAVAIPSDIGPEYWRLEGKIDEDDNNESRPVRQNPSRVDDIVAQVEASLGRHVSAIKEFRRIQDGGYEESAPGPPSPQAMAVQQSRNVSTRQSGGLISDIDMDMGDSAAGLMDRYHAGLSSNVIPGSGFPTPQSHLQAQSSAGTLGLHAPSPQPAMTPSYHIPQGEAGSGSHTTGAGGQASFEGPGGDWVVVTRGGVSPGPTNASLAPPSSGIPASSASPHPATAAGNNSRHKEFSNSPIAFTDMVGMDTAGEALAGFGDSGGMGDDLGLDMDVGMDDSAFGEAFHGIEPRNDGDDGHGDGI
ncbi:hypothetical protein BJ878DRAFT_332175 [Calycina marina]|uniref:DUF1750-domain-containing protein n=1 Tax=Calycina marina TaxID=1763456 RepID=A0A9P7Z5V5_9HELO|nr:hypothetical protein BJ878DRAFT_332175 [Calycina marina]